MSAIREIFKTYGPEYLARFGARMPASHKKVMRAICKCRSGEFGSALYRCDSCGRTHLIPASCGNRHCPTCQHHKADDWLAKQLRNLLPCHYFLLTFTVPELLRLVMRSHQRVTYDALFSSSSGAIKKLARDPRFVGTSQVGLLGVLHTWGGMLQYHPHIHFIVPAGGISPDGSTWLPSRKDLFVHTRPLARIFKAKFRDALDSAGLLENVDPSVWQQDWIVDSQSVGNGQTSFRYLARYVFRVAVSNARIVSYDNHTIVFRHKDRQAGKWRTASTNAIEFIRRFLQHVLPTGFMKIRHYGFLSSNYRLSIQAIRELVCVLYDFLRTVLPPPELASPTRAGCPRCGGTLRHILFIRPFKEVPSG